MLEKTLRNCRFPSKFREESTQQKSSKQMPQKMERLDCNTQKAAVNGFTNCNIIKMATEGKNLKISWKEDTLKQDGVQL